MSTSKASGERLEFYDFSNVTIEHLHRYAIAKDFVDNKIVLDIASGEGYGSNVLSKSASKVIGVDIDLESVNEANKKYIKENLKFIQGSADNIPVESNSIDVVISFETIEHHDKHEEMLLEIKRVLKKDGILIMSSPDKKYYSDMTGQVNVFHVKELYFDEFKNLIDRHFSFTNFLFQNSFNLNSFIGKSDNFCKHIIYTGDENSFNDNFIWPVYNIVIASEVKKYNVENSFFDGSQIAKRINDNVVERNVKELEVDLIKKLKKSNTFRIGSIIVYPFFIGKKNLKKFFS